MMSYERVSFGTGIPSSCYKGGRERVGIVFQAIIETLYESKILRSVNNKYHYILPFVQ